MSAGVWRSSFRGYDDTALTELANSGLMRRAHKAVDAGQVALVSEREDGGILRVGDSSVNANSGGPPAARCDCSATGTCQHILAVSIWVRESLAADAPDVAPTTTALDELLNLDPIAVARAVGVAATRSAHAFAAAKSSAVATFVSDASSVQIRLPSSDRPIRYFASAGFEGMVSDYPVIEKAERHLTAIRLVFQANGKEWTWPKSASMVSDTPTVSLTRQEAEAIVEVRATLNALLGNGVAHLGDDASDRLSSAANTCRVAGLHSLSRLLADASGIAGSIRAHSDTVSEAELVASLAEASALCEALSAASDAARLTGPLSDQLRGVLRRAFDDVDSVTLTPLDARWFETSGGRGATFTFADATGELITATAARPSGIDPSFGRDSGSIVWGTSATGVLSGVFCLRRPRLDFAGALSAGDQSTIEASTMTALTDARLDQLAVSDWAELARSLGGRRRITFGSSGEQTILLRPTDMGTLRLDEELQRLTLPLLDTSGQELATCITLNPSSDRRADVLISQLEHRARVAYLTVHRRTEGGRPVFELSSIVVRDGGALELIALDFARALRGRVASPSPLRQRLSRLVARFSPSTKPTTFQAIAPTLPERVCAPILSVLEDLAATGRPRINERQSEILTRQRIMARDLDMSAVVAALDNLARGDSIDPGALLRCYFIAKRALDIAA